MLCTVVLSGKGGVGKSTVAVNLAKSLQNRNYKVGIVDLNIMGSNVPKFLNMPRSEMTAGRIYLNPILCDGIKVISVANMTPNDDQPVMFKGDKRRSFVKHLVRGSDWGDIDFLIGDMPPATGDELLSLLEIYKSNIHGAVIVTMPSELSIIDVEKMLDFCRNEKICVFGLVVNMQHFVCPKCSKIHYVYNHSYTKSIEQLVEKFNIEVVVNIPITLGHESNVFGNNPLYGKIVDEIVKEDNRCLVKY